MASSYQDSTEHLSKPNTTSIQLLNEITNKVFEDLRQGQCNRIPHMPSDHDSLKVQIILLYIFEFDVS